MTDTRRRNRVCADNRTSDSPANSSGTRRHLRRRGRPHGAGVRFRLTAEPWAEVDVHGGWWPRSTNLPVEFPPLLSVLSGRYGDVESIRYHPDDWSEAPQYMEYQGSRIHTDSTGKVRQTVTLTGPAFGQLTLRVVAPYTNPDHAYQLVTATPVATQLALHRWENEGGAV